MKRLFMWFFDIPTEDQKREQELKRIEKEKEEERIRLIQEKCEHDFQISSFIQNSRETPNSWVVSYAVCKKCLLKKTV